MNSVDITVLVMIGCGVLIGIVQPWQWNWFSHEVPVKGSSIPVWLVLWVITAIIIAVANLH